VTVSEVSTIPPKDPLDGAYYRSRGESTPRHHKPPSNPSQMRKIETLMNDAVANNKNWQSANTSVVYCEENDTSTVYLHGNKIAEVGDNYLQVFDGGWQSNTTKSRLNALINRFCNSLTDGVYQRQHVWYLTDNKVEREFESGYIFA